MRSLTRVLALALAPMLFGVAQPALARFERAELEQMLAPIALYPDSVLSHVLIAATYPDQVWEAARWSRRHPDLEGEAAVDAVEDYDWDPSVKALAAFPDILARMDEDPDWTERLGDAFLDQEGEVMDSVQVLRDRAYDAGRLDSLEYVRVIREREYIYIEPAVRTVVYIPYYDPWFVYGTWGWPSYPPYCWRTWRGHPAAYYPYGFHWGVGFRIAPSFYFTSFYWPQRYVVVAQPRPNWRPLYSGRDAGVRHEEVRHWREARGPTVTVPRRGPAGDRRVRATAPESRHDSGGPRVERRHEQSAPRAAPAPDRGDQPRSDQAPRRNGRRPETERDDARRSEDSPARERREQPRRRDPDEAPPAERGGRPSSESRGEAHRRPEERPVSAPREQPEAESRGQGSRAAIRPEGREPAAERRERKAEQPKARQSRGRERSARER